MFGFHLINLIKLIMALRTKKGRIEVAESMVALLAVVGIIASYFYIVETFNL